MPADGPLGGGPFGGPGFFGPLTPTGGIGFQPNGRRFTKRGLNFKPDDGTCAPCDCDNPPGSGRNTQSCPNCPSGVGPVSALLTFSPQPAYIDCSVPDPRGQATITGTLGSYCLNTRQCEGASGSFPNLGVHSGLFLRQCDGTLIGEFIVSVRTNPGPTWEVFVSFTGGRLAFHGVSGVTDCASSVVINNDNPTLGTNFSLPGFGPNALNSVGQGGSLILTPQFFFCA
jgi:hypothetical protein